MKIKLNIEDLISNINWITKAYNNKTDKSNTLLFLGNDGSGYMSYENNTTFVKSPFSLKDFYSDTDKENFTYSLDTEYLQRFASAFSHMNGEITLEKDESLKNSPLYIKGSFGKFTIPVFKNTAQSEKVFETLGTVNNNELFDALLRLSKICDSKNAGIIPAIETVDANFEKEDKITLMATDRYTLGEITIDFNKNKNIDKNIFKDNSHVFIPYSIATLLRPENNDSIDLIYEKNTKKFGYFFPDTGNQLLFSPEDATPLSYKTYKNLIKDLHNYITVDLNNIKKSISQISTLSPNEDDIFLNVENNGKVFITNESSEQTMIVNVDEVKVDKSYRISFIKSLITEAFSPISSKKIRINWSTTDSPFIIEDIMDNGESNKSIFSLTVSSQKE